MAKRDIDKQIEQIRERLVVLNKEAIVCMQSTPAKRRSHTNSNQLSKFCNPVLKISFHSATGNYSVGNQDMTQPDKSLPQ